MQQAEQTVIQHIQYPSVVGEPKERVRTTAIRDDWDKLVSPTDMHVLSDDEEEPSGPDTDANRED